jgi:hypothetical protein
MPCLQGNIQDIGRIDVGCRPPMPVVEQGPHGPCTVPNATHAWFAKQHGISARSASTHANA